MNCILAKMLGFFFYLIFKLKYENNGSVGDVGNIPTDPVGLGSVEATMLLC